MLAKLLLFVVASGIEAATMSTYSTSDCSGSPVSMSQIPDSSLIAAQGICISGQGDGGGASLGYSCSNDKVRYTYYADASCSSAVDQVCLSTTSGTVTPVFSDCYFEFESGVCHELFSATVGPVTISSSMKWEFSCGGGSDPCFARDSTTACRILDHAALPKAAYTACFVESNSGVAERVLMAELTSGDLVLSSPTSITRVVVNQHMQAKGQLHELFTIHHAGGNVSLTPDHSLEIDGELQAAHVAVPGMHLSDNAVVTRVTRSLGGIINPITVSGTILAAGPAGAPIMAATHPEWIADWFVKSSVPFPVSFTSFLTYMFPSSSQGFYDSVLEDSTAQALPTIKAVWSRSPSPLRLILLAAADVVVAFAGVAYGVGALGTTLALSVFIASVVANRANKN